MIHATDHFAARVHERVAPDADPAEIAAGTSGDRPQRADPRAPRAICRKCKEVTGLGAHR